MANGPVIAMNNSVGLYDGQRPRIRWPVEGFPVLLHVGMCRGRSRPSRPLLACLEGRRLDCRAIEGQPESDDGCDDDEAQQARSISF